MKKPKRDRRDRVRIMNVCLEPRVHSTLYLALDWAKENGLDVTISDLINDGLKAYLAGGTPGCYLEETEAK